MHEFFRAFDDSLCTLRREWERRLHSLKTFRPLKEKILSPPGTLTRFDTSLLLIGAPCPDYSTARRALQRDKATIVDAHTPSLAAASLERSSFDAAILIMDEGVREYLPLLAAMRAHPATRKLSVLLSIPPGAAEMAAGSLAHLAVTLAPRPAAAEGLRQWVRHAVLHSRLARALATAFIEAAPEAAGSAPGVFSNAFARAHLETLLSSSHAVQTSLAQFNMSFTAATRFGPTEGRDFQTDAASALTRLLPDSVMVADAPETGFWLLFPESGGPAADSILTHAARSLRARPVTPPDGTGALDVFPHYRIVTAQPGENVPAFVRRCGNAGAEPTSPSLH